MGCLPLGTDNLGDLKLFSYRSAFSNVLNFASEPKKPEQDLKGTKNADIANTSEKASEQGKGWGSWCSLQYLTHLICLQLLVGSILTLVTQTPLPPPSNLLSTSPFPPNQPAMVLEGLLLKSHRRGHPQSLISACALGEFRFCELEKLALWFLAISYAGHVPCRPFEDTVKEMSTLPAGALGTATPREPSSCVKGSTRNPANMHQGNSFALIVLLSQLFC